ncbi:MAG: T9SS type A sorting domain-containing protein, partial [Bacteroidota bacterium]
DGLFSGGEEVVISAIPAEGYEFINWTDANNQEISTQPELTIIMPNKHHTLKANFDMAGSAEINQEQEIEIYPNPAKDNVKIFASNFMESVNLLNLNGEYIFGRKQIENHETNLNVESLKPGMYILEVVTRNGTSKHKIQIIE